MTVAFTSIPQALAAGWAYDPDDEVPVFEFRRNGVAFHAWQGADGRWYGNRHSGGNVTDDFNYGSRRSMLRAVLGRIGRED